MGFPGGSTGKIKKKKKNTKKLPVNAGDIRDMVSIPELGRSPAGGHGSPFQYSCLENLMDRGVWQATVHRVTRSRTRLKQLSTHTCLHGPSLRQFDTKWLPLPQVIHVILNKSPLCVLFPFVQNKIIVLGTRVAQYS